MEGSRGLWRWSAVTAAMVNPLSLVLQFAKLFGLSFRWSDPPDVDKGISSLQFLGILASNGDTEPRTCIILSYWESRLVLIFRHMTVNVKAQPSLFLQLQNSSDPHN